ncbi:MAG: endoribonuclease MazF [Gammaproteobacteria bacterium]
MTTDAYVPERGDLVMLDFNPQSGHEQFGRRPAIVLSPRSYNSAAGLAVVCPVTNQQKGYPFEVPLGDRGPVTGVVLADQIKSIDWRARRIAKAAHASKPVQQTVIRHVGQLLAGR